MTCKMYLPDGYGATAGAADARRYCLGELTFEGVA